MSAFDENTGPAVEVSHLTREFWGGVRAIDDVTLEIAADSIVGLLGRNGAGKTTLMSLITAQDHATSGQVRVFGEDPWENDRVLSQTCFIRESQVYPNNYKVKHVLAAGKRFYPHWDEDLAKGLVEDFALPSNRQVAKLSRGMRSSVGILVGLASRAPLTIFDEPYLGLDATARQQFYDLLIKEYAEHPRTIVLSSHLIDEIGGLLQDAIVLHAGRPVLSGAAEELTARACVLTGPTAAVEELAGSSPVLHREPIGGYVALTLDRPADSDLLARAQRAGVEVGPVSLQTLVVRAGLGRAEPTTPPTLTTGATR
jgi:ABC-2 type transport system ATP-binding protein